LVRDVVCRLQAGGVGSMLARVTAVTRAAPATFACGPFRLRVQAFPRCQRASQLGATCTISQIEVPALSRESRSRFSRPLALGREGRECGFLWQADGRRGAGYGRG
jgi:hypothetical protein